MSQRSVRVRRWTLATFAGLLALLGVAIVAVQSEWFGRQLARVAEAAIDDATGERALIGGLRLGLWPARARVDGLLISHRSDDLDADGASILALESLDVRFGWRDGEPVIRRIVARRPAIELHLDDDGLREFAALRGQTTEGPTELPWDELWVDSGTVQLHHSGGAVRVHGLDITPEADGRVRIDVATLAVQHGAIEQVASGISLPGVQLGPDRLVLPRVAVDFPALNLRGDLALRTDGPVNGDLSARVDLSVLNDGSDPTTHYTGAVLVDVDLGGTVDDLDLSGALALEGVQITVDADSLPVVHDPGPLWADWSFSGRQLRVHPLITHYGGGQLELDAAVDVGSLGFSVTMNAESVSLYDILKESGVSPAPWVDFTGDLELEAGGTLDPLYVAGTFHISTRDFVTTLGPAQDPKSEVLLSLPAVYLEGETHVTGDVLRIWAHDIATRDSHGAVDARIPLDSSGILDVALDMDRIFLDEFRPLGGADLGGAATLVGNVHGPYEELVVDGEIGVDDFVLLGLPIADRAVLPLSTPRISLLRFEGFEGWLGDSRYVGQAELDFEADDGPDLDLQLLLRDGRLADLVNVFVDVDGLDGALEGAAELQGPVGALDGEISLRLSDVDVFGERFETGKAEALVRGGRIIVDPLTLSRRGSEAVWVRGSMSPELELDLELRTGGIRLENLDILPTGPVALRGRMDLDARVRGPAWAPRPEGRVTLRDTWFGLQPVLDSTVYFETDRDELGFVASLIGGYVTVEGELRISEQGPWRLEADLDRVPLHLLWPVAADGSPIRAVASGLVVASGALGENTPVQLAVVANDVQLDWRHHELRSGGQWVFTSFDDRMTLKGIRLSGGDTQVSFGGSVLPGGKVMFAGDGAVDLELLEAVVPGLERSAGLAQVNVSLSSLSGQLEPRVDLRVRGGELKGEWFPKRFSGISARISGSPDGYLVSEASGRMGGGAWTAGGKIAADGWVPSRFDLWAKVDGARVRYLDYLPAVVGGADLRFDGPVDDLLLSGKVNVDAMVFSDRIDWEQWLLEFAGDRLVGAAAEATEDYFSLDLEVEAKDTVRMRNNVGDFRASARLRFLGDTARLGMVGDVRVSPGGRAHLKERDFEINRAELHFIDPFTFDPDLDIDLTTDVSTRDAEYQIGYQVSGLYSDWRAVTTSDPHLPQADINALLLFGMTREDLERYGGITGALSAEAGDLLASTLVGRAVGGGIERIRLERIDLVSGVSERGSGTISSELRLLTEWDIGWDTRVIGEKTLDDSQGWYVGVEKRLARKLYTRGYWASDQVGRRLDIGAAIGVEFNVRWELD